MGGEGPNEPLFGACRTVDRPNEVLFGAAASDGRQTGRAAWAAYLCPRESTLKTDPHYAYTSSPRTRSRL